MSDDSWYTLYGPSTLYIYLWVTIAISTVTVKQNHLVALESIMTMQEVSLDHRREYTLRCTFFKGSQQCLCSVVGL